MYLEGVQGVCPRPVLWNRVEYGCLRLPQGLYSLSVPLQLSNPPGFLRKPTPDYVQWLGGYCWGLQMTLPLMPRVHPDGTGSSSQIWTGKAGEMPLSQSRSSLKPENAQGPQMSLLRGRKPCQPLHRTRPLWLASSWHSAHCIRVSCFCPLFKCPHNAP